MGDSNIGEGTISSSYMPPDVGKKFFEDASNSTEGTGAKLERVGEVTAKGLALAPKGALESAASMLDPKNYGKDAEMIASSAAFGAVLRVALPESGALKTAAGVVMGAMFLKDAVKPVGEAWDKVWKDGSAKTMTAASHQMGSGLGDFAVQGTVSVLAAGAAAKMTPGIFKGVAPKTWENIENFKTSRFGGAASVDLAPKPQESLVSKTSPVEKKPELNISLQPTEAKVTRPGIKDLTPEQIRTALIEGQSAESARIANHNMTRFGIKGSDGNFHSYDDAVQMLLDGKDPAVEKAGPVPVAKTVTLASMDLTKPGSISVGDKPAVIGPDDVTEMAVRRGGGKGKAPTDQPPPPKPADTGVKPTDTAAKPTDTAGDATGKTTDAAKLLNVKTMSAQADAIKANLAMISDEDGLIMDAMNRNLGAIDVRTNPDVKPLTGYDVPRKAAFDLAQQVGTDPGSFQQVNPLYERFASGALQSGTPGTSDISAHVVRMDQYAKENFETYRQNIIDQGIDPNVALAQKPQAPLVEGTSDVERVGTDADGNPVFAHQGPHTVRAIYGPNGETVWPVDMVKTPIREIGMRGVNTSGIYGHEYMHDQFGHLAEFDPEVRDAKLGDAAAKALGADADKMVDLPGGGKDPQQVLLDSVVRKMAKVDAADQDAFLTEQLGLDQRTRVIRAARAADEVLGATGRKMIQVPNQQPMPLELFVGNIAAMADERTPSAVLAELQGKGTPDATSQAISANIDKILGPNGKQALPLEDGSHITLKDAIMKVSDQTRNPKFETYDKPLPKQMSNKDILVNVAKAWADETFADWGAAAESGQSAAPYFQALSKDGMLRSATVIGQDMRNPNNELGIEAHPTDALRPRYQAALIRALATAKGGHDQVLLDWADALTKYSRDASKPGPISFPSMDNPGQAIQIPQDVFDKFIPELVDAQLNTPLPRLQGKTLFDILPDLRKNFRINQGIADTWESAIKAGKGPEDVAFDAGKTKMTNVYGAGQLTFLKLVSEGMDPVKANDAVNQFSDHFGDQIVQDRAAAPAAPTPQALHKLNFAAMSHGIPEGAFKNPLHAELTAGSPLSGLDLSANPNPMVSSSSRLSQAARWSFNTATSVDGTAALGAYQINDLLGLHQVQHDLLDDKKNEN
jgi:hypothetical protein